MNVWLALCLWSILIAIVFDHKSDVAFGQGCNCVQDCINDSGTKRMSEGFSWKQRPAMDEWLVPAQEETRDVGEINPPRMYQAG